MKEAMWGADPSGSFRFSDSTDPSQEVLFDSEDIWLPILLKEISSQFFRMKSVPVEQISKYVEGETIFLKKHMRLTLQKMEDTERIKPRSTKKNGSRRKKRTFPDGVVIDFK